MAWVQCKGCDCDDKTSLHNTLEDYCMDCAAKRVKGYDNLQAENKRLKEEPLNTLWRVKYSLEKLGKEATILLIDLALKASKK